MKIKNLLAAASVVLIVGVIGSIAWELRYAGYQIIPVETGRFRVLAHSSGHLQATDPIKVHAAGSGRVDKVIARENQQVEKGDILAWYIESKDLARLEQAQTPALNEEAKWNLKLQPVLAPNAGVISKRVIIPGQMISPQTELFAIVEKYQIQSFVSADILTNLHEQQEVEISIANEAKSKTDGTTQIGVRAEKVKGHIQQISHTSITHQETSQGASPEASQESSQRTYEILIEPQGEIQKIAAAPDLKIAYILAEKPQSVLLPAWLAHGQGQRTLDLIVKTPKGETQSRQVKLGQSNGEKIEVLSDLSPSDVILYRPNTSTIDRLADWLSQQLPKQVSSQLLKQVSNRLATQLDNELDNELPNQTSKQISAQAPGQTSQQTSDQASGQTSSFSVLSAISRIRAAISPIEEPGPKTAETP